VKPLVIVLTACDTDDEIERALRAGAKLTPREMAALRLLADGRANEEIAGQLDISWRTAKAELSRLFEKLGVTSRADAVKAAVRRGLVTSSD
jgi:DNA-binding NarL/FixJ family response regulator